MKFVVIIPDYFDVLLYPYAKMTKPNSRISRNLFTTVYIGGILLAMLLGVGTVSSTTEDVVTWHLLAASLCHLFVLVYLGYRIKVPSIKVYAGERIQTAGYLHTLIGFSVAISLLGTSKVDIGQVGGLTDLLVPMGSALVTSILGWLFGGEIAEQENNSLEQAIFDISRSLKEHSKEIRGIEKRQREVLREHQSQILDFHKQSSQEFEDKLNNLVSKMGEYNESILSSFNQFNSMLEDETHSLRHSFNQLSSVIEEESYSTLPRILNQLSSVIEENSCSLSTSLESLQVESQNAAEFMSSTAKFAENTAINLSTTADAAHDTANYLKTTDTLVQQMEELLKYTLAQRLGKGL